MIVTSSASLAALDLRESIGASSMELDLVLGTESLCGEGPSLRIRDGVGAVELSLGGGLMLLVRTVGGVVYTIFSMAAMFLPPPKRFCMAN